MVRLSLILALSVVGLVASLAIFSSLGASPQTGFAVLPLPAPDLVTRYSGTLSALVGQSIFVTGLTSNIGSDDSPASVTQIDLGGTPLYFNIPPLSPGQRFYYNFTYYCDSDKVVRTFSIADYNNKVVESNESNNKYGASLVCKKNNPDFVLHEGDGVFKKSVERISFDTGLGESEAILLNLTATKDFLDAPISVVQSSGEVNVEFDWFVSGNVPYQFYEDKPSVRNYSDALYRPQTINLAKGESAVILVVFNGVSKPTRRNFDLSVSLGGGSRSVPFEHTVWSVKLPDRSKLKANYYVQLATYGGNPLSTGVVPDNILEKADEMVGVAAAAGESNLRFAFTDVLLYRSNVFIGSRKMKFGDAAKAGYLNLSSLDSVKLDFTNYDPLVKIAKKHGLSRFEMVTETADSAATKKTAITLTLNGRLDGVSEEMASALVVSWVVRELAAYGKTHGFSELNVKISDEIGILDDYVKYAFLADYVKRAGGKPFTTGTGIFATSGTWINALNKRADSFVFNRYLADEAIRETTRKCVIEERSMALPNEQFTHQEGSSLGRFIIFNKTTDADLISRVQNLTVYEDGIALKTVSGSSYKQSQARGKVFLLGWIRDLIVVASSDGPTNPPRTNGRSYELRYTICVESPKGRPVGNIDFDDKVWFYGGYSDMSQISYYDWREVPWVDAYRSPDGIGIHTLYYWTPSHGLIWYDWSTKQPLLSKGYWAIRDGYEEALYLTELMNRIQPSRKIGVPEGPLKEKLSPIIGFEQESALKVKVLKHPVDGFTDYVSATNVRDAQALRNAKRVLLSKLAN